MKKEILDTFIERYNLGGLIPKVKWKYDATAQTLHARAAADNKSFIVDVILHNFNGFGNEDAIICIGDTNKIKGMLSPFGEDINLAINRQGDKIQGFSITDLDCESYCTAADPSAMDPVAKNLQDVPEYHAVVPLSQDFLEKFLKARTALKDVDAFSIGMNKKNLLEFVIGYTTSNSNRIRITPPTDPVLKEVGTGLSFPVKNIAEAFKSNSDITDGTLSVNDSGLIKILFKNDDYTCTYYQFANKKA